MKSWIVSLALLVCLIASYVVFLDISVNSQRQLANPAEHSSFIPGPLLKVLTLEFDGIASDFIFLKALTFMGETQNRTEVPRVLFREYVWLLHLLKTVTDLDPYFYDPYYFANAHLVWNEYTQGQFPPEKNDQIYPPDYLLHENIALLDKGIHHRDWDWYLLFMNGFNLFYFLGEDAKASEYLMAASRKTRSSPLLTTLASRLAFQDNNVENAIIFLEQMIQTEDDENIKNVFIKRQDALKAVKYLTDALEIFISRTGKTPVELQSLIDYKIIQNIPQDPYGGTFYIDEDGKVKTTSNFIQRKY